MYLYTDCVRSGLNCQVDNGVVARQNTPVCLVEGARALLCRDMELTLEAAPGTGKQSCFALVATHGGTENI